jgi:hypothetical protein
VQRLSLSDLRRERAVRARDLTTGERNRTDAAFALFMKLCAPR